MARLGAGSRRPPSAPLRRMASNPLASRTAMFSSSLGQRSPFRPLAGPPEPTHCQNGSRRGVHKSGVICKIMRFLWPWTHMDTDFPMTLYETKFMRSYGNQCPPVSSVSKDYPYSRRNPA